MVVAEIKVNTEDQRRPVLSREERIDFYPQQSLQLGVREEKEEGELRRKDRGYNESQGEGEIQERREESKAEGVLLMLDLVKSFLGLTSNRLSLDKS